MREIIQLDIVRQILTDYSDDIPVHFFLKDFYKQHRQFGSRDRKFYSDIIYKYFRCKTLFQKLPFEEKLCYSGFITTDEVRSFYSYLFRLQKITLPLIENWNKLLDEKLELLMEAGKISFSNYFPASDKIDKNMDREVFYKSHLSQPKFFVRISEKHINNSIKKLNEENISFSNTGGCFEFDSKLDLLKYLPDENFEVQDLSSQQTIELFELNGHERIWDCCSGAGGKSLMLLDKYPDVKLFCSDKRSSILENLKLRFNKKQMQPDGINVFDVAKNRAGLSFNDILIPEGYFDFILADVPCSGSGTWGRNPERMYQFKEEEVEIYSNIQRSIIENAVKYLKPGGILIYITCSVYMNENTLNVGEIEKFGLKTEKEKYFIGYNQKADTMYGAVMKKEE